MQARTMGALPPRLRPRRYHVRVVLAVVVALTLLSVAQSYLVNEVTAADVATPTDDGRLVVTIDAAGPSQLVAYGADGSVVYRNRTWQVYHDVDPSPAGADSVMYVATNRVPADRCAADSCTMNVVERINLSTDAVTRLATWVGSAAGSSQIHDVDRVNDSVLLVADISYPDRVFMYNTTTDQVIWQWHASQAYEPDSGGAYPADWTHINDVEYLPDGRVMADIRNQDQVVFIRPGEGVQKNWTLGADGNHSRLFEQHNPDYIPASQGGPAVLVADSENNRVVEYQRANGSWHRSWQWADERMQWPRDADRQPNGQTLIVDSHGSRLLSVAPNGSVTWSHPFPTGGYDAELLDTPPESAGPSAARLHAQSHTPATDGLRPSYLLVTLVPPRLLHALLFVLPTWTTALDAVLLLLAAGLLAPWLAIELGVFLQARARELTVEAGVGDHLPSEDD
ncbi:MAG: aryl-sulfate sulfotransferase [Haloarculaceae archaeon]